MLADGACAQAFFLEADASLDLAVGGPAAGAAGGPIFFLVPR